jgi:hypothetical protein
VLPILLVILPLVFPTGRTLGGRWANVLRLGVGLLIAILLGVAFMTDDLDLGGGLVEPNPMAVAAIGPVTEVIATVGFVGTLLMFPAALASLVVRYRRAQPIELGARLRDSVDVVALSSDLRATAVAVLHPSSASVWLRSGGAG